VVLPTADRDIHITGIDLDCASPTACLFRRDQDRSATAEGVKNQIPALGTIPDRICDKRDWLDRRMHRQFVKTTGTHGIHPVIVPDVASMPTILAKLERIDVGCRSVLPGEDEFML